MPDLKGRLTRAAKRYPVMSLALAGAGRFDERTLWLGCSGDIATLRDIARSVAAPAVGLAPPLRTTLFDSVLTSHWPVPAARWTYGPTSLRSVLIGVGRGLSTLSLWCVPIWVQTQSDIPGMKPCRRIGLAAG